jgi:outer membrane lipoprotein
MRISMNMVKLIPVLLVAALTGCASVMSPRVLQQVDKDVTFEMVLEKPEAYAGKTLLLGGDIIEAQPFPKKTVITVLQRPLGLRDQPLSKNESKGRFIAEVPGFLDPAIYRKGRQITVAGTFVAEEVRPLGKMKYTYPVIRCREIHLWPMEGPLNRPRFYFGLGFSHGF